MTRSTYASGLRKKIVISEAAAIIAEHMSFTHRATKGGKLISQQIRYAIKLGKLRPARLKNQQAVWWDEVCKWAAQKSRAFARAYGLTPRCEGQLLERACVSDFIEGEVIPGDILRCQAHLKAAYDEIAQLRFELQLTKQQLLEIQPLADSRKRSTQGLEKGRQTLAKERTQR